MTICDRCQKEADIGDMLMPNGFIVSPEEFGRVIHALKEPIKVSHPSKEIDKSLKVIQSEASADAVQVEDLLAMLDIRVANTLFYKRDLSFKLGLLKRTYFAHPNGDERIFLGRGRLSLAGVACLLSWLERAGFAKVIGDAALKLAPRVKKGALLTSEQHDIANFAINRHSMVPITLDCIASDNFKPRVEEFLTETGYLVKIKLNKGRLTYSMKIEPPRIK